MSTREREHLTALAKSPLPEVERPLPTEPAPDWALGRWQWLVPVTVAAAVGAWVIGSLAYREQGFWRIAMIIAGALLTGATAGLPLWQHHRASEARAGAVAAADQARAAMRVALEDALDPMVHVIGRLTELHGHDKAQARGEAIQVALNTIAALADATRVRVCFYALDRGPPQVLRPDGFSGRAGAPTDPMVEGTRAGDSALRLLADRKWVFVADAEHEPVPPWWSREYGSLTLLAGPVATADSVFGLLTLDAEGAGDLAQVDPVLVRLMAALLATALAV